MSKIFASCKELKSVKALVVTAMMTALGVVLHLAFTVPISDLLMIKFSFVPTAIVGMLYGPIPAALCGGMIDVLSTVLFPKSGGIILGISVCAAINAFLYGVFFYRVPKLSLWRVLLAQTVRFLLVTMFLMPLVLSVSFGTPFWATVSARLVKIPVTLVETAILYAVLNGMKRITKNS